MRWLAEWWAEAPGALGWLLETAGLAVGALIVVGLIGEMFRRRS